jgi:predicted O-methyltransferase YrrM
VEEFFRQEIEEGKVETHRMLGGDFLYALEDNSLDWIYLDATHEYAPVNIETTLSLLKVKPNGFVMGHDYVVNANTWRAGTIMAINERLNTGELKMEAITIEEYPSFLCRVIK